MEDTKQEATLEENFQKLDEVLKKLGTRDIALEEAFRYYQQGQDLALQCDRMIDRVEKNLQQINKDGEVSDFPEDLS